MLDVHGDLRRSDTLAVAFTGVMDGLGGIPFEFHRSISQSPWAGLFVRDTEKIWYQYEQSDIDALVRVVSRSASEAGATRIVCLGNSMGGFGAILFGRFLRADAIIAFAPQTCIEPTLTDAIGDFRWRQWQETIRSYPQGDLAACDPGPARITMVCGADEPLDRAHIDRFPWPASRRFVPRSTHDVASRLRASGQLTQIIESALS